MSLWYKGEKQKNAPETSDTFLLNQFEISIDKYGWNNQKQFGTYTGLMGTI